MIPGRIGSRALLHDLSEPEHHHLRSRACVGCWRMWRRQTSMMAWKSMLAWIWTALAAGPG